MNILVYYGLLVLAILFLVAVIIGRLLFYMYPTEELHRVLLRIKTWFYIIAIFAALFIIPSFWSGIILFLIVLVAWWEIWMSLSLQHNKSIETIIFSVVLSGLVAFSLFYGYHLLCYKTNIFFFVVVLTQLNDIFQYLWGKSLGKRAIMPKISPSKTWAGFLGGVFTSASVAYFVGHYYLNSSCLVSALVGGVIAICGFCGDMTVSFFKRKIQVKDMGFLLPGHGGLLDRIDSLLYVLPLMTYI